MKYNFKLKLHLGCFSGILSGEVKSRPSVRMPGLIKLQTTYQTQKNGDQKMLQFTLTLPPVGAPDVVSRELTTKVGDAEPVVVVLTPDVVEQAGFECEDNAVVTAALVDVDDAGNRSEAREQSWTVVDTIAPPLPGELGLLVTGETA